MRNYKYIVEISKENKELIGKLSNKKKGTSSPETYTFCPTNLLCDLTIMSKNHYFKNDKNLQNMGYKTEYAFGKPIHIDKAENFYYYYPLAELIKDSILNNKKITIEELEKIKLFFNINLNYSISLKERNPLYEKLKGKKNIKEFTYIPLEYGHCNIDKIFEDNKTKSYKYLYKCDTLTEVIFAILHYLVTNKYNKTRKCNHCEKFYFYKHSNSNYCNRKTPIKTYSHLNCEQAVKDIKQLCERRNKIIDEKIDMEYYHNLKKYRANWKVRREEVEKSPTVKNLIKLYNFTSKDFLKKHFYIDKK